jgi:hypothetical protein
MVRRSHSMPIHLGHRVSLTLLGESPAAQSPQTAIPGRRRTTEDSDDGLYPVARMVIRMWIRLDAN